MITIPGKMAREVLRHSVMPPATREYPFVKAEMPDNFRGKIIFDGEKCIGCRICIRDCPAKAVNILKVADRVFEAEFHLDRCIYCAQCVDSCPRGALDNSGEFELAQIDRTQHRIHFHAKTGDGDVDGTP